MGSRVYGTAAWRRLRVLVLHDEGFVCRLCGGRADQVDHIVALHDGGRPFDRSNCQAVCGRCNILKELAARGARGVVDRRPAEVRPW